MPPKTCIIIAGPTAVGKTALSVSLASMYQTSIISADSRQCYREMNIGVAKPSASLLESIPHYFISSHSIHEHVNAAVFEQYALRAAAEIFSRHDTLIMTGGTGLYLDAFCGGIDEMPEILPSVRSMVREGYNSNGLVWLQKELEKADAAGFQYKEAQNPHRLMRALEVILSTGRPLRSYYSTKPNKHPFTTIKIGLDLPRETLYQRINNRVDSMIGEGLVDEVSDLMPYKHLSPLNTIGYKELVAMRENGDPLSGAIEGIKTNTRHYAKRQLTWFRKDPAIQWFHPDQENSVREYIERMLNV